MAKEEQVNSQSNMPISQFDTAFLSETLNRSLDVFCFQLVENFNRLVDISKSQATFAEELELVTGENTKNNLYSQPGLVGPLATAGQENPENDPRAYVEQIHTEALEELRLLKLGFTRSISVLKTWLEDESTRPERQLLLTQSLNKNLAPSELLALLDESLGNLFSFSA